MSVVKGKKEVALMLAYAAITNVVEMRAAPFQRGMVQEQLWEKRRC
jgi:hypothetical protein